MTSLAIGGTVLAILYIAVNALDLRVPVDVADEVQDDPRLVDVLRAAWADRETQGVGL